MHWAMTSPRSLPSDDSWYLLAVVIWFFSGFCVAEEGLCRIFLFSIPNARNESFFHSFVFYVGNLMSWYFDVWTAIDWFQVWEQEHIYVVFALFLPIFLI